MEEIKAAEAGCEPCDETQEIFKLVYEVVTALRLKQIAYEPTVHLIVGANVVA